MQKFKVIRNSHGQISHIETSLTGYDLLNTPALNKGCAFTAGERALFQLEGLLPRETETLEQQVARMYAQYQEHKTNLGKNIYLNVLHDYNETLFYHLVNQHLEEMLPIIYTPTVGEAVERFSLEHRKTRGIYISYPEQESMDKILNDELLKNVDLIVVTDGEAVLGIGDQGIGGIKIATAKLMVYTLCGGINPYRVLPIQLDVGTNNPQLLSDPMYLGWRHERIAGKSYDDFVEKFVSHIHKKIPHVFLHWEDVGRDNARRILTRYREKLCTFNGDMQGTGTIALASVLAGTIASGIPLKDQRIVIFGAGTAGVGIADQIHDALKRQGLNEKEAYERFWLIDRQGLILKDHENLLSFQKPYARNRDAVSDWQVKDKNAISLNEVVRMVKPTTLIGCSTQGGAFTEEIVRTMAKETACPVIMPLSNPTYKSEARPEDLFKWTEGRAIIATGSPFPNVIFEGRERRISQSNNALAFPGIGLGAMAVKAAHLSDDMLWIATETLARECPVNKNSSAPLLPKLSETKNVSYKIALAVGEAARQSGLARIPANQSLEEAVQQVLWEPRYYPYKRV